MRQPDPRRADPEEWQKALEPYEVGKPVKGIVLLADRERGLAIDLPPVVGWVDWAELPRGWPESRHWKRLIGTHVFGHVATKNAEDDSVTVTMKQASIAARDLLTQGDVVVGRVTGHLDDNRGVFVQFTPTTIYGLVPANQIPIEHRDNQRSVYQQGSLVSVEVARIDWEASLTLSIAGALRQRNEVKRRDQVAELQEGQEVAGVVVSSDLRFAGVDIGAVIARIWREEQSLSPDSEMRLKINDKITAVIMRIDQGGEDEAA